MMRYHDFIEKMADIIRAANTLYNHPGNPLHFEVKRGKTRQEDGRYSVDVTLKIKAHRVGIVLPERLLTKISTSVANEIEESEFYERTYIHLLAGPIVHYMDNIRDSELSQYDGTGQAYSSQAQGASKETTAPEQGQSSPHSGPGQAHQDHSGLAAANDTTWPEFPIAHPGHIQ